MTSIGEETFMFNADESIKDVERAFDNLRAADTIDETMHRIFAYGFQFTAGYVNKKLGLGKRVLVSLWGVHRGKYF